jgi:hypothetical protein
MYGLVRRAQGSELANVIGLFNQQRFDHLTASDLVELPFQIYFIVIFSTLPEGWLKKI